MKKLNLFMALIYLFPVFYITLIPVLWLETDNILIFITWAIAWVASLSIFVYFLLNFKEDFDKNGISRTG